MLDASNFIKTKNIFYNEFKIVLKIFIESYYDILKKEKFKKNKYNEDILKNILIKYARIKKSKFEMNHLLFLGESGLFDDNYITIGYNDIRIYNLTQLIKDGYVDENQYYTIECKRINKYAKYIKKYINEGINRFVIEKYSKNTYFSGMIGFVEDGNIKSIIKKLNKYLKQHKKINTNLYLINQNITNKFNESFFSRHERINIGSIEMYHLFFDYSKIII